MDRSLLADAPLFRGLSEAEIETILNEVHHRLRRFSAGSLVAQSGEPVISMIIVTEGIVKGEMVDYAGRVIKIEDITAPGALAAAFIFGKRNRYPVNVVAVSDGELLIIEKTEFLRLLKRNEVILVNFLDMISNRSQFLSEKIKFLNFKTIKGKLAFFILQKAGKDGTSVNIGMTQSDLAEFFGVARPSVARALGDMEESGYISARGKIIIIIDREGLAGLTSD